MRPEELRTHYEVEKELAARLRGAPKEERRRLYASTYDELCRRVPFHLMLQGEDNRRARAVEVARELSLVRRFVRPDATFLELGPGDCGVAVEMARYVRHCYAIDVSEELTRHSSWPDNFQLFLSDGSSVPLPPESVDVTYSSQLMEHLHPDDAMEQLRNVHRTLKPAGRYICRTPNRLSGPHDVSRYFDEVATGFHLKEYTVGELAQLFQNAGFSEVRGFCFVRSMFLAFPLELLKPIEALLAVLPRSVGQAVGDTRVGRAVLGINVVAVK